MATMEEYLQRLGRELQTSPEETDKVLREVRSHLECAMLDLAKGGESEVACLPRAIEQFGGAERIGGELRQVHGRATWQEAGLAALPLFVFSGLASFLRSPLWVAPSLLAGATLLAGALVLVRHARWPLWWWAWLGWLPFAIPNATDNLVWGAALYVVILLLVSRRDWLEATLSIYPLPTAWAFQQVVATSNEVRAAGWSALAMSLVGLGMAAMWALLLVRTLRTPSGIVRVARVLEGQGAILALNATVVIVARLWPTQSHPYVFTPRRFFAISLPYALLNGLPFLAFMILTSLPAVLALAQKRGRAQRPPSRPAMSA